MTTKWYGINKTTMDTFRSLVKSGMNHDATMWKLKAHYLTNKDLYDNPPDFSNVYGHPHYVSQAGSTGIQADKG